MTETTKNPGEKTLTVTPTKTLTLKGGEQGVVRQSFSHGRSKAVVVEKVKRRVHGPAETKVAEPAAPAAERTPTARRGAGAKSAAAAAGASAVPAGISPKPS